MDLTNKNFFGIILKKKLNFPIGLIFIKKYVIIIMGENNNKPIGFIQIDRTYEDSRSAFREKLRPYRGR